jgi:hypothetical protein
MGKVATFDSVFQVGENSESLQAWCIMRFSRNKNQGGRLIAAFAIYVKMGQILKL